MRDTAARGPEGRLVPALRLRLQPTKLDPRSGENLHALKILEEVNECSVVPLGSRPVKTVLQREPFLQRGRIEQTLLLLGSVEESVEKAGFPSATHGTS